VLVGAGNRSRRNGHGRKAPRPGWLLRHPREVLALAFIVLVALGLIGTGVTGRLDPTSLNVPGTASSKADALLAEHFGDSAPFAILLRGPAAALEEQGPQLVRALRRDPKATTLSPWDKGSLAGLRPAPDRALILVDFHVDVKTAVNDTVPRLNRLLEREVRPPVKATQSGFATLSRAIQDESIDAAERGELIALPILLIVLLLVFRSPIAAAIPLGFGAITVLASRGILWFFTSWFDIDAFALTVCTMMGLALGVDYALLMVSRFREEIAKGAPPVEAARLTRRSAGRTVAFAGSTLLISMLVSLLILPGSLLASLAGTVAMVVVLSVTVATLVGPAILTLVGTNLDRWRIGTPAGENSRLMRFLDRALRRPALAAILIGAVLLALAAPAIGLKTGPPSPEELSSDAPTRQNAELIDHAIGPGWDAPFQIVAANPDGPITDPATLTALDEFQQRVSRLPGVKAVIGPDRATRHVAPLQKLGNRVFASRGNIGPVKELGSLGHGLRVAAGGVGSLRAGIGEASAGAGLLAEGSGRAVEGARLIAHGLRRARRGSARAIAALERLATGSRRLEEAEGEAAIGELQLRSGINASGGANLRYNALRKQHKLQGALDYEVEKTIPKLARQAGAGVEDLTATIAGLEAMGVGRGDPVYAATLEAARRAQAELGGAGASPPGGVLSSEIEALGLRLQADSEEAREVGQYIGSTIHGLKRLEKGAARLAAGLDKIHEAGGKLASGAARLSLAARSLGGGIEKLSAGASALVSGLGRLAGGAEALEQRLAEGAERSAPLESGLEEASVQVIEGHHELRARAGKAAEASPGIFNSGYFVLSALDGAPRQNRERVAGTIDLDRGGQAASILVISHYSFNTPGSIALGSELEKLTGELGRSARLETGVAGGVAQLNEYSKITRARIPLVIAAIALVTFLVLIVVLRAIPLAAIAVGLNLLTVGVAFGILTLLFHVPAGSPLGGHKYVDAVGATMIFGIVFGLSIDYAVFLLSRMRESYDRGDDNEAAARFGLEKTARVITGAAAIMLAVFVVFAGASISTVSQLGIGLTVAVVLDATVVRIVLLPALMLLLGDRVWWLPASLERLLPKLSV
jgi:RND superfamily putative drug exporter